MPQKPILVTDQTDPNFGRYVEGDPTSPDFGKPVSVMPKPQQPATVDLPLNAGQKIMTGSLEAGPNAGPVERMVTPLANVPADVLGGLWDLAFHLPTTVKNMVKAQTSKFEDAKFALSQSPMTWMQRFAHDPVQTTRDMMQVPANIAGGAIPIVGPAGADIFQQAVSGDVPGAIGSASRFGADAYLSGKATELVGGGVKRVIAPAKAAVKNYAAEKAPNLMRTALNPSASVLKNFGDDPVVVENMAQGMVDELLAKQPVSVPKAPLSQILSGQAPITGGGRTMPLPADIFALKEKVKNEIQGLVSSLKGEQSPWDVADFAKNYVIDNGRLPYLGANKEAAYAKLNELYNKFVTNRSDVLGGIPMSPDELHNMRIAEGERGFTSAADPSRGATDTGTLFEQGTSLGARASVEDLAKAQGKPSYIGALRRQQLLMGAERSAIDRSASRQPFSFGDTAQHVGALAPSAIALSMGHPFFAALAATADVPVALRQAIQRSPKVAGSLAIKAADAAEGNFLNGMRAKVGTGTKYFFQSGVTSNTFDTADKRTQELLNKAIKEGKK